MSTNKTKQIIITFKGNEVTIKETKDGLYSLTELWKVSGKKETDKPVHFTITSKGKKSYFRTIKGGKYSGTYADEKTVYKYAAWIDDDFYDAVFESFKAAVNGDGDKAVSEAQKFARAYGKTLRRLETDDLKAFQEAHGFYGTKQGSDHYAYITQLAYSMLGLTKADRDEMTAHQLHQLSNIEAIITECYRLGMEHEATEDQILRLIKERCTIMLNMMRTVDKEALKNNKDLFNWYSAKYTPTAIKAA